MLGKVVKMIEKKNMPPEVKDKKAKK